MQEKRFKLHLIDLIPCYKNIQNRLKSPSPLINEVKVKFGCKAIIVYSSRAGCRQGNSASYRNTNVSFSKDMRNDKYNNVIQANITFQKVIRLRKAKFNFRNVKKIL